MNPIEIVLIAALVVWVLYRQVTGRFVRSPERAVRLPLVLCGLGLLTLLQAHPAVTTLGVLLVGGELLVTAALGVARGSVVRLQTRDGWLYARGGVPMLLLWVLTVGIRIGTAALAGALGVGALSTATLTLSFAVSLAVQALVLNRRVVADGRPIRQEAAPQRRGSRATL